MRSTEAQIPTGIDAVNSGIEGYAAYMKRYPVLSTEQTEAALFTLRSRQSLHELRSHTLFAPHLAQEERDLLNNPHVSNGSPVRSYRQLFADSPTIGHLVAFGNVPTLRYWAEVFQTTYNGLPLPLEEFMQDALFQLLPDTAQSYVPTQGASFTSYLSHVLIWRLDGLVDASITQRSMLPKGAYRKELKAKHDTRRKSIASLDAPFPEETDNGEEVCLYDHVAQTKAALPGELLERTKALHTLLKQAGITLEQAQVLQTYVIEEESQNYAAGKYGVTMRAIRYRRDSAMARLRSLGYENVVRILNGDGDMIPPVRR